MCYAREIHAFVSQVCSCSMALALQWIWFSGDGWWGVRGLKGRKGHVAWGTWTGWQSKRSSSLTQLLLPESQLAAAFSSFTQPPPCTPTHPNALLHWANTHTLHHIHEHALFFPLTYTHIHTSHPYSVRHIFAHASHAWIHVHTYIQSMHLCKCEDTVAVSRAAVESAQTKKIALFLWKPKIVCDTLRLARGKGKVCERWKDAITEACCWKIFFWSDEIL